MTYLWGKATDEVKKQIAASDFKKWGEAEFAKYEDVIRRIDDLEEQGTIDAETAEKFKKEKIAIEENLLNGVSHN